ncbi:MAG TPA: hypothetical protein PKA27_13825 [Fimbriimonadaceae bacterium]|nr:hypothetical protein [Fimbriimonadaceae bacterium]
MALLLTLSFAFASFASAEVQLHDNGSVINGTFNSNPVSIVTSPNSFYGYGAQSDAQNRVADDFVAGSGWRVESLRFAAYQTNAPNFTFTTANVEIRRGNDVNTAVTIYSESNLPVTDAGFIGYRVDSTNQSSTGRPVYRISVDITDTVLDEGQRYWIVWSLDGSLASGPWIPQVMSGVDPLAGNGQQSLNLGPFAPVEWGAGATSELPFEVWGTALPVGYANMLIACDSNRSVYSMSITGAKTLIGTIPASASTSAGLAFDRQRAILYLTSTGNDALYRLNLSDFSATLVGPFGDSALVMHGLEYDNRSGILYGASQHNGGLYSINTETGQATLLGTTGLTSFLNLVDIGNSRMFATSSGTDSFYRIDTSNAISQLVGPLTGPSNPNGITYHSGVDTIFLVDNTLDNLYFVNRNTGAATLLGSTGTGNLLGLAFLGSRMEAIVRRGELFEGDEVSLHAVDGDRYSIFNNPVSLAAVLDVNSYGHRTDSQEVGVLLVGSVGRPGISINVRMRNATNGIYDFILGGVATTTDSQLRTTVRSPNYVDSTGAAKLRITWAPINDEDATQDGWLHSLDMVYVNNQP